MNIYSQKQRWKIVLSLFAFIIVCVSFYYTSILVDDIAREERQKVKLWAEAVQKKAKLVRYTNKLFQKLADEEVKKIELWAQATSLFATSNCQDNIAFFSSVAQNNTTIPVIVTDGNHNITPMYRNLDLEPGMDTTAYLKEQLLFMAAEHDPIEIPYYANEKLYIYYKNSKLFTELKNTFQDIKQQFISELVIGSASTPVVMTNASRDEVIEFGNLDSSIIENPTKLAEQLIDMEKENQPLEVELADGNKSLIFYQDSLLLTKLKFYPILQLGVISLFILISYLLFSTFRRGEQNQVWVGMSKETAHQLGTPLSSLMAWMEILKTKDIGDDVIEEINKDIKRLETITDRFSKIGSVPKLESENVTQVINNSINYIQSRTSDKVQFSIESDNDRVSAKMNIPLFEWVVENLCKNAIDAMGGTGSITVEIQDRGQWVYIDVTDTGKGIPSSRQKTVFQPGFTTKRRGWGLGLSLSKRIIQNYHNGKIFVRRSEVNKGTTFRIILKS